MFIEDRPGVIPTRRAEHLEFAVFEPPLGRCSRGDLPEGALAVVAPRVGARHIDIVAPKETNADARIDGVRDMRAYESYSLPTVSDTRHLGHENLHRWCDQISSTASAHFTILQSSSGGAR